VQRMTFWLGPFSIPMCCTTSNLHREYQRLGAMPGITNCSRARQGRLEQVAACAVLVLSATGCIEGAGNLLQPPHQHQGKDSRRDELIVGNHQDGARVSELVFWTGDFGLPSPSIDTSCCVVLLDGLLPWSGSAITMVHVWRWLRRS
jgi:hypothetical protein